MYSCNVESILNYLYPSNLAPHHTTCIQFHVETIQIKKNEICLKITYRLMRKVSCTMFHKKEGSSIIPWPHDKVRGKCPHPQVSTENYKHMSTC